MARNGSLAIVVRSKNLTLLVISTNWPLKGSREKTSRSILCTLIVRNSRDTLSMAKVQARVCPNIPPRLRNVVSIVIEKLVSLRPTSTHGMAKNVARSTLVTSVLQK